MIAIDIALVPKPELFQRCLELNRPMSETGLRLDAEKAVPHLTLGMAVVPKAALPQVLEALAKDPGAKEGLNLEVIGSYPTPLRDGRTVIALEVGQDPELYRLHHRVMTLLQSVAVAKFDPVEKGIFFTEDPKRAQEAATFVNRYPLSHSFEAYRPHITLGMGEEPRLTYPIAFSTEPLRVYQIGPYCSCAARIPL